VAHSLSPVIQRLVHVDCTGGLGKKGPMHRTDGHVHHDVSTPTANPTAILYGRSGRVLQWHTRTVRYATESCSLAFQRL
jgi:hypothetical protein